jgi:hypothetical protein
VDHASYLRVLLSVWVGLGLGQLVQALNRLVRFHGGVRWDWLPLTWAGLAFLMVVQVWWAYFTILQSPIWTNLVAFLLPLLAFVILYLICAAALPDVSTVKEGQEVDLTRFHFSQNRYFFGLWTALLVIAVLVRGLVERRFDLIGDDGYRVAAIFGGIVMARSSSRSTHVLITVLAMIFLGAYIAFFTLTLA